MRLEPLYRVRFTYPESWSVGLDGGWQQMFFLAECPFRGKVSVSRSTCRAACRRSDLLVVWLEPG